MRPNGWGGPIIIDLDGVEIPSQHRPALRQHNHEAIVGHTTAVNVSRRGFEVEGTFSGQDHHAAGVVEPASRGFQWQLSVGADPLQTEYLEHGEEATVNNRKITGPMTISRQTRLGEISFVPLGADGDTHVIVGNRAAALAATSRKTTSRKPTRSKPEPAPFARGIACRFEEWTRSEGDFKHNGMMHTGIVNHKFRKGALTQSLLDVAIGRQPLTMTLGRHGGQKLSILTDGWDEDNYRLDLAGNGTLLLFTLRRGTKRAREIYDAIRATKCRGLSLGVTIRESESEIIDGQLFAIVTKADIRELTVCLNPSNEDCTLALFRRPSVV
jgi:phage head maturation protease